MNFIKKAALWVSTGGIAPAAGVGAGLAVASATGVGLAVVAGVGAAYGGHRVAKLVRRKIVHGTFNKQKARENLNKKVEEKAKNFFEKVGAEVETVVNKEETSINAHFNKAVTFVADTVVGTSDAKNKAVQAPKTQSKKTHTVPKV